MSIMSRIFNPTAAVAAPTAPAAGPTPAAPVATAAPAAVVPVVAPVVPVVAAPAIGDPAVVISNDPAQQPTLDTYAELWQPITNEDGSTPTPGPTAALATLDPKALQNTVAKADLISNVTPEQLVVIEAGGPEATKTMLQIINEASQASLAQAVTIAHALINQGVSQNNTANQASVAEQIRAHSVNEGLTSANPIFSNPAVKPMLDHATSQFRLQHPEATANQITVMAQDYVLAMAQAIIPKAPAASEQTTAITQGQDFSKWGST